MENVHILRLMPLVPLFRFFLLLRNFCGDFGWYYLALLLIIQVLAVLSWKG
jgi:hypothetical protein